MTSKKPLELLIGYAIENPTLDATKAEALFQRFLSGGFSYDEISNRPDSLAYASAKVLGTILPLMIDEMLARKDTGNFLIYPMIAAVDPSGEGYAWRAERTEELVRLVEQRVAQKILKLLMAVRGDAPVPIERLDRIIAFWAHKAGPSDPSSQ
jgi:hypothetical protein